MTFTLTNAQIAEAAALAFRELDPPVRSYFATCTHDDAMAVFSAVAEVVGLDTDDGEQNAMIREVCRLAKADAAKRRVVHGRGRYRV